MPACPSSRLLTSSGTRIFECCRSTTATESDPPCPAARFSTQHLAAESGVGFDSPGSLDECRMIWPRLANAVASSPQRQPSNSKATPGEHRNRTSVQVVTHRVEVRNDETCLVVDVDRVR